MMHDQCEGVALAAASLPLDFGAALDLLLLASAVLALDSLAHALDDNDDTAKRSWDEAWTTILEPASAARRAGGAR